MALLDFWFYYRYISIVVKSVFCHFLEKEAFAVCFLILLLWPTCSSPPADGAGLALALSCALDLGLIKLIVNRWSLGFLQIPSALAAASTSTPLGRSLGPPRNPRHLCCFALSLTGADGLVENGRTRQPVSSTPGLGTPDAAKGIQARSFGPHSANVDLWLLLPESYCTVV